MNSTNPPVRRNLALTVLLVAMRVLLVPSGASAQEPADDTVFVVDSAVADGATTQFELGERQIGEFETASWELTATAAGAPAAFQADVTVSADIEQLVVDLYVNGTLVDSVIDPNTIFINLTTGDFEPSPTTTISLVGREISATECARFDGVISFDNVQMLRQPHAPRDLADAIEVTVNGDDPVAVANIAAAVERETIVAGATVALESPITVSVEPSDDADIALATVTGLANQRTIAVSTLASPVNADRRMIQRTDIALERMGGSTFLSATGFGGRVNDVAISGEIHSTPLSAGGGFAIDVNGQVIASGDLDEDGFASFESTFADWPRDADVAVRLALREDRNPCAPQVEGFAGTANLNFTPLPASFGDPVVRDFPQRLLEASTVGLWVAPDVPTEWVGVAIAAIQDTSVEPLRFHAADEGDALLRLTRGTEQATVEDGALTLALSDDTVAELSADRFWNVGVDAQVAQQDAIGSADSVAINTPGAGTPQAGWVFIVIVAAMGAAILVLFWKNSRQAP